MTQFSSFFSASVFATALFALPDVGTADEYPVVVELYTSQGCSSCPPADALLGEVAKLDNVIALALHVDYWDYIGWKDEFADPSHTMRQRAYARAAGTRTIYTPQMIVEGKDHIIGFKAAQLAELLSVYGARPDEARVELTRDGGDVIVSVEPSDGETAQSVIQIATYTQLQDVDIRRGENAGRTLSYHNVVREFTNIGAWDGKSAVRFRVAVNEALPVAVIVQTLNAGPVLGAAKIE